MAIIFLSSCRKETSVKPLIESNNINAVANYKLADTIADGASFKIRLWTDVTTYDETAFIFRHGANVNYVLNEDALYMPGMGDVSLASISTDGQLLAINTLPYHYHQKVHLDIETKTATAATLGMRSPVKIPSNLHVWLRDKFLGDSTDLTVANHNFNITADPNSFGNKRFVLLFKLDTTIKKS